MCSTLGARTKAQLQDGAKVVLVDLDPEEAKDRLLRHILKLQSELAVAKNQFKDLGGVLEEEEEAKRQQDAAAGRNMGNASKAPQAGGWKDAAAGMLEQRKKGLGSTVAGVAGAALAALTHAFGPPDLSLNHSEAPASVRSSGPHIAAAPIDSRLFE